MPVEAWLPVGHELPGGFRVRKALKGERDWQIVETQEGGRALISTDSLAERWVEGSLVEAGTLERFSFGDLHLRCISSGPEQALDLVAECSSPQSKSEALAFALALQATREVDESCPLQDAIYVERMTRLLPTFGISDRVPDDVVFGFWLTGGARVSVKAFRRLSQMMSWLAPRNLIQIVKAGGFDVDEDLTGFGRKGPESLPADGAERTTTGTEGDASQAPSGAFELPGRPELEAFFNEHIVEIVRNKERYRALGIAFPPAFVLHGPPGCGKTFAVERLVEFLGWPSFAIEASSVASPFIHDTSRKVAEVFTKAMEASPSVLVIDEMEAFLADRDMGRGSSHHRVEEVAEFLRRIPEATANEVLVVAMTNRLEMIDPAILRRGRFDHVLKVALPSKEEVKALLSKLLSALPREDDIDTDSLAVALSGRPLSDVAFVVREGARLSAKTGLHQLSGQCLVTALGATPSREGGAVSRRIGFL